MKNNKYLSTLSLTLALFLALASCALATDDIKQSSSDLEINSEIQNIGLAELLGIVQANKGKVIMINIFASWCPPCKFEIPGLVRLRTIMSQDDIVFIGVSTDDTMADLEKFTKKTRFNYPVYLGKNDIAQAFNVDAIPYNIVYDRSGRLVLKQSGYVDEKDLQNFLNTLISN